MREIKFRAFRKKTKQMYQFDEVELITNDGYIEVHKKYLTKENIKGLFPKDFEVMQFTGLKDKQGKEIYHFDWLKDNDVIVQIDWYGDKWDYAIIKGAYREQPRLLDLVKRAEVIGNKYETR